MNKLEKFNISYLLKSEMVSKEIEFRVKCEKLHYEKFPYGKIMSNSKTL